ncbi:hypothetical protein CI41S_21430 [Bradyrhizobium ivorense]|nr:hypothetical protein CI41S_21430 [Bradyrhizobium ivorense]
MLSCIDVDPMIDRSNASGCGLRSNAQNVIAPDHELVRIHPDQMSGELVGELRPFGRTCQKIATADIDFVFNGNRDCIAGLGAGQIAALRHNPPDARGPSRRCDDDVVPHRDASRNHGPGVTAEIQVRPVHPLHRKAEGLPGAVGLDINIFQLADQAGTIVPVSVAGAIDDIVAVPGRDRDRNDRFEAKIAGKGHIVGDDPIKGLFAVVDEVDLVHRQDEMADTKERTDERVALGLDQHTLAGIDEDDSELGIRGARCHVASILLVAGRVGHHERAPFRRKETIGHIDGDALLSFRLKPVDEQREIDVTAGSAVLGAVPFQRRHLIIVDHLAVVQQAADQRRLSVIHRTARDESQLILWLGLDRLRYRFGKHQK